VESQLRHHLVIRIYRGALGLDIRIGVNARDSEKVLPVFGKA